mgnify:CR=1 FL=1
MGSLTFNGGPIVVNEESWRNGITKEWWGQVDWDSIRESQDLAKDFDKEVCSKIYLGGIEAPLRAQVKLRFKFGIQPRSNSQAIREMDHPLVISNRVILAT